MNFIKHRIFAVGAILLVVILGSPTNLQAQNDGTATEEVAEKGKKKKDKKKDKAPKKEKKKKNKKDDGDGGEEIVDERDPAALTKDQLTENPLCDTIRTYMGELCPRYKTGRMKFIDKNFVGIDVKRTKKKEIWTNTITQNKLKFKIDWDDNCCYTLTFKKAKKPTKFSKNDQLYCRIRRCSPDPENYCDVDMDLNTVINYASLYKPATKTEVALKAKKEKEMLAAQEAAERAAEEAKNNPEAAKKEEEAKEGDNEESTEEQPEETKEEAAARKQAEKEAKEKAKADKKAAKEAEKARKKAEKEKEKAAKEYGE